MADRYATDAEVREAAAKMADRWAETLSILGSERLSGRGVAHDHAIFVPDCFRCDLSREEC